MIDFEALYNDRVERCSHETAFNKEEAKALFDLLYTLPEQATIVEIGVEFGRSTTVIGSVAKEREFTFIAIDAWLGEYSPQARAHVENILIKEWRLPIVLISTTSGNVWNVFADGGYPLLDLVHVDGDHEYAGVLADCNMWGPLVKVDGYLVFDDYGHDSLPDVYRAVQDYMNENKDRWEFVGRYGNKLGVFRKIK